MKSIIFALTSSPNIKWAVWSMNLISVKRKKSQGERSGEHGGKQAQQYFYWLKTALQINHYGMAH
jgi:hypothetical protein